jgi:hypothetical protein
MGYSASKPDPNVNLQVIGCGMSRTGTASFAAALEILLGGPVYHGGSQLVGAGAKHQLAWINIFQHTPIKSEVDRKTVHRGLESILGGYTACADMPPILFAEELVEVFQHAKFICTTRDPETWWKSMKPVTESIETNSKRNEQFVSWALALLPSMMHWTKLADAMKHGRFGELYYQSGHEKPHPGQYREHMEYIKRVVPAERLWHYDIKDGWEPLCKILECDVPNVPFPHVNDAEATDKLVKRIIQRGIMAWAGVVVGAAPLLAVAWSLLTR